MLLLMMLSSGCLRSKSAPGKIRPDKSVADFREPGNLMIQLFFSQFFLPKNKAIMKQLLRVSVLLLIVCTHTYAQTIDSRTFGDIKARWIGPSIMSGRIACVDVMNSDSRYVYVGSAGGGVWKSEDF